MQNLVIQVSRLDAVKMRPCTLKASIENLHFVGSRFKPVQCEKCIYTIHFFISHSTQNITAVLGVEGGGVVGGWTQPELHIYLALAVLLLVLLVTVWYSPVLRNC